MSQSVRLRQGRPPLSYLGLLPYHSVDPQGSVVLLIDQASGNPDWLGLVWRLHQAQVEVAPENALYYLSSRLEHVLEALPEGMVCQMLLRTRRDIHNDLADWVKRVDSTDPLIQNLVRSRTDTLENVSVPVERTVFTSRHIDVYFTVARQGTWERASVSPLEALSTPLSETPRLSERVAHAYQQDRRELLELGATLEELLKQAKVLPERLNEEDLAAVLYEWLNPTTSHHRKVWPAQEEALLRDRVADSNLTIDCETGTGELDAQHFKAVSVIGTLGPTCPGELSRPSRDTRQPSLLDLAPDMTLALQWFVDDQTKARNRLGRARRLATNQAKDVHEAPSMDGKRAELEDIERALSRNERILRLRITALARSDSAEKAGETARRLSTAFTALELRNVIDECYPGELFLQSLPFGYRPESDQSLKRSMTIMASNVADLLPLYGAFRGTRRSTMMLLTRSGETLPVGLFTGSKAPHCITTGMSGSGKSFLTNQLVQGALLEGGRVIVFDVGRSYRKSALFFSGTYVDYDETPKRVNPCGFSPKEGNCPEDTQTFLKEWLTQIVTEGAGELTRAKRSLLTEAVRLAYRKHAGCEITLSHIRQALVDLSQEQPQANELALCLLDYVQGGAHGTLFDGPTELDFTNPYIVIDLGQIAKNEAIGSVLLMALAEEVRRACQQWPHEEKYFIVDEAWELLRSPAPARVLEAFARKGRKERISLTLISQNLADFDGKVGNAISQQAATKIYLEHDQEAILASAQKQNFSEPETALYQSLRKVEGGYSEIFIKTDAGAGVGRLVVDPISYWLATTHPADLELLDQLQAEFEGYSLSPREVLARSLEEAAARHPRGVAANPQRKVA